MAIYGLGWILCAKIASKTACWVSIDRPIFLQSEIQIL